METMQAIKVSTNIICPTCRRKLCKIKDYSFGKFIEVKHKKAFVLAVEAIIGCISCQRTYQIDMNGSVKEIQIEG